MMVCFCVLVCLFDSLNLDWHEKGARESTYSYDVCQWLHLQMHLVCTNRNVGPWRGHKGALGTLRQSGGMYINALR